MPNLSTILKQEITRLARKEIRSHVNPTKSLVAQHRRELAMLKRAVKEQEKKLAFLEGQERRRIARPVSVDSVDEGARFSARSVRSQRRRLRLSAQAFAKLAGVSTQTIYHWEQGKTRPREPQFAALVAIRNLGRREAQKRLEVLTASSRPRRKK